VVVIGVGVGVGIGLYLVFNNISLAWPFGVCSLQFAVLLFAVFGFADC
jgi:hypothetical protein